MRTLWLTLFVSLLASSVSAVSVRCVGDNPPEVRGIASSLPMLEYKGVDRATMADSLLVWFQRAAYLDASVTDDGEEFVVNAGEQFRLERVVVEGDSSRSYPVNYPFVAGSVDRTIRRLLLNERDAGRYFASVEIVSLSLDQSLVTATVRLIPGPEVRVGKRIITGLKQSKPEIVARFIQMAEGDVVTERTLREAERDAAAVPHVVFDRPAVVRPRPGYMQADVEFRFREKRQFNILGGVGYIPDDPTGLVWDLDMKLANLFGGGREIALKSARREKNRRVLNMAYRQPMFALGVGSLEVNVATRDYRDDFYEFALGGRYSTDIGHRFTAGLGLAWKRVEPADESAIVADAYSSYTTEFSVGRSSLDHTMNSSTGLALQVSLAYTNRRYSTHDDSTRSGDVLNETRSRLSIDAYRRLFGRLVSRIALTYEGLETSEALPPLSELFFIGGPGTVRGFRNEQFTAQRALFGTIEPRLRFSQGYLFVFYDAAYINRPQMSANGSVDTEELYRQAAGVGLGVYDSARSVKMSVGWQKGADFDRPRLSVEFSSDL